MLKRLTRSYSLLKLKTFLWQFCLLGPIITFTYILAVKPFGFALFPAKELRMLALYFSAPPILIWAVHLYLLRPIFIKRLTILNTILFLLWINLVIGIYNYTFAEIYIFGSLFDFYWLPMVLQQALLLGAAVSLILITSHAAWMMRRKNIKQKRDWYESSLMNRKAS